MPKRQTLQREAILAVIHEADRPLSPQEIFKAAGRRVNGLGLATVYRAVKAAVEEGQLTAVDLPQSPTRYEPAGKAHHHHFECRACHRVFEVKGCPGRMSRLAPRGFKVQSHELILYGLCAGCRR